MTPLTEKQEQVLSFIRWRRYFEQTVTIRVIAEHFGICSSGASQHLWALRKKGYITWVYNKGNTIMPVEGLVNT